MMRPAAAAGPAVTARAIRLRVRPTLMTLLAACSGAGLIGCGQVQVRPLATGVVEQPAYMLSGETLAQLRSEAQRLCPQGAEVLRQAQRVDGGHESAAAAHWSTRWLLQAQQRMAPPSQGAQLTVLCQPMPGDAMLAKAPIPAAASSSPAALNSRVAGAAPDGPRGAAGLSPVGEGDVRDGMSAALPATGVRQGEAPAGTAPVLASRKPTRASSAPVLSY